MELARHIRNNHGVTYLALMFSIVLIGISASATTRQWVLMVQREKEADLVAKGIEIQNALSLYSATMKIGRVMSTEVYPQSLAELTRAPKPYSAESVSRSDKRGQTGNICAHPPAASWACGVRVKPSQLRRVIFRLRSDTSKVGSPIMTGCFSIPIPPHMTMLMPPMMGVPPGGVPAQPGGPGAVPAFPCR